MNPAEGRRPPHSSPFRPCGRRRRRALRPHRNGGRRSGSPASRAVSARARRAAGSRSSGGGGPKLVELLNRGLAVESVDLERKPPEGADVGAARDTTPGFSQETAAVLV